MSELDTDTEYFQKAQVLLKISGTTDIFVNDSRVRKRVYRNGAVGPNLLPFRLEVGIAKPRFHVWPKRQYFASGQELYNTVKKLLNEIFNDG